MHRRLHRLLHRATEGHAALQLLGDDLGDEAGGQLGALDLVDRQMDRGLRDLLKVTLQLIDPDALATHQHAGTRGVDDHVDGITGALDLDARDAGGAVLLLDVIADRLVLTEKTGEVVLAPVPTRGPGLDDPDAVAGGVDLLSHRFDLRPQALAPSSASSEAAMVAALATITVR